MNIYLPLPYMKNSRLILSFSFAIFIVFSLSVHDSIKEAHACSCISPNSPKNELQTHDVVFSGKVIKIDELHPTAPVFSSMDPNIVLFEVDTI